MYTYTHTHTRNSLSQYPPVTFQARGIKSMHQIEPFMHQFSKIFNLWVCTAPSDTPSITQVWCWQLWCASLSPPIDQNTLVPTLHCSTFPSKYAFSILHHISTPNSDLCYWTDWEKIFPLRSTSTNECRVMKQTCSRMCRLELHGLFDHIHQWLEWITWHDHMIIVPPSIKDALHVQLLLRWNFKSKWSCSVWD